MLFSVSSCFSSSCMSSNGVKVISDYTVINYEFQSLQHTKGSFTSFSQLSQMASFDFFVGENLLQTFNYKHFAEIPGKNSHDFTKKNDTLLFHNYNPTALALVDENVHVCNNIPIKKSDTSLAQEYTISFRPAVFDVSCHQLSHKDAIYTYFATAPAPWSLPDCLPGAPVPGPWSWSLSLQFLRLRLPVLVS